MNTVYLVEDHWSMREVLAALIEEIAGLELCGQAESAEQALLEIPSVAPDLLLLDVLLPGMSGIELARQIRARQPDLPILFISAHDESVYGGQARQVGAQGYVVKGDPVALMTGLQAVLDGKLYFKEVPST